MHFLHILNYTWENGGPSKVVYDLAKYQSLNGHRVTILSAKLEGQIDYKSIDDVEIIYAKPKLLTKILPLYSPDIWNELKNNANQYDVIHLHLLWNFSLIATHYLKLHNKIILTIHGSAHPYTFKKNILKRWIFSTIFQKEYLKKVKLIHLLHIGELNEVETYLNSKISNYLIAPNGISIPNQEVKNWSYNKDILFLGRLHEKKGLNLLLPAFLLVLEKVKDARLIIAGPDYGMLNYINQFISKHHLQDSIIYIGSIIGEEKLSYLRNSQIFVLPSYSEGFSIAVLEALVFELPIVVSTETGLSSEIVEYNAGLIIDFNEVSISSAINELLLEPKKAKEIARNGLKLVKEKFETSIVLENFMTKIESHFSNN